MKEEDKSVLLYYLRLSKIISACLFLLTSLFIYAQDSLNVRFVGGYPFGQNWWPYLYPGVFPAVTSGKINNHKYIFDASGSGIMILNVDAASNPQRVGSIIGPTKFYPFLVDTLLYTVALNRGLRIYDVSDPGNPVEIGKCPCPEWMWALFVKDSFAYATGPNQLTIFNVSDPANPFIVATWSPSQNDFVTMYVSVQGYYAYVTAERSWPNFDGVLYIIDVSTPSNPILIYTLSGLGNVRRIKLHGNYAYIVTATNYFYIIDISNPSVPIVRGTYNEGVDIDVANNYAYISTFSGFRIVDISNPASPFAVGSVYIEDGGLAVNAFNEVAYIVDFYGVSVIDISEPQLPFIVGEFPRIPDILEIEVSNNLAIVSSWLKPSISTIDIADPSGSFEMDNFKPNTFYPYSWLPFIRVQANHVYVGTYDLDLLVLDISNPANMQQVGQGNVPGWTPFFDVFIQDNYLYFAAAEAHEFGIFDISDPMQPDLMGGIPISDTFEIYEIFVINNYAYCAAGGGLKIIDVSDSYNPYVISKCSVSVYCDKVFVSGDYAYLGDCCDISHPCFWIIDISDIYNPYVVNQYPDFELGGIFVAGNYAFVGSRIRGQGLKILDITDPVNYQEVGYYKTPYIYIYDLNVVGNRIYLSTYDTGLWVLEYYGPGVEERVTESAINGLQINTICKNIKFSYTLRANSMVNISLIDICGRVIEKTIEYQSPGNHSRELNSKHIPSGVYFLKIETGNWRAVKKLVLLK